MRLSLHLLPTSRLLALSKVGAKMDLFTFENAASLAVRIFLQAVFRHAVEAMSKSTIYSAIVVLVVVDVIQSGYKSNLEAKRVRRREAVEAT